MDMEAADTRKSARVEQRGRFTITHIEPDSPAAAAMSDALSFAQQEADDAEDGQRPRADDGGVEGEREGDVDIPSATVAADLADAAEIDGHQVAAAAVLVTSERISPFGSAVFEHSSGDGAVLVETAVVSGTGLDEREGDETERRIRSETFDETVDNRRVKQKGRFTIIELSSGSPRSRRNSAEEFSNTTSISITSTQVTQANAQHLSSSPATSTYSSFSAPLESTNTGGEKSPAAVFARMVSESNTSSTRAGRSKDGQENDPQLTNRSRRSGGRRRSVSPSRDREPGPSPNAYHTAMSASYGRSPLRQRFASQSSVEGPLSSLSPQLNPQRSPFPSTVTIPSVSLSSSYSSVSGSTPTATDKRPELGANRRHLASRQKAITISAEQFIQQQHTIASLIRQQQELKQLIGVLAEQQQHLVGIPRPLVDFGLDQSQSEAHEQSMREVQIQMGALSRANDALQTLLSEAEHDAHERTMEIECLSNENNELRYRFSNMERRYRDEKKKSFTLEQELQRTRRALHAARQKNDKNELQKQKMIRSSSSRELLEDPVADHQPPGGKLLI